MIFGIKKKGNYASERALVLDRMDVYYNGGREPKTVFELEAED